MNIVIYIIVENIERNISELSSLKLKLWFVYEGSSGNGWAPLRKRITADKADPLPVCPVIICV